MKRQLRTCLSLLALSVFAFNAQAQITITRNDFGDVGDFTVNAHDTIFAGLSPGSAGASQTWNLDTLQNHYIDTTYFITPGSTPYPTAFPTANIAAYSPLDTSYIFVNANSTLINVVGNVLANPFTGSPTALSFTPPVTQITFPSSMGTLFNVTNATAQTEFAYSGTFSGFTYDSLRATTTVNRSSQIDGWGNTMTPVGTFNSLRQRIYEINNIAIEAHVIIPPLGWTPVPPGISDTTVYYYYLANGQIWPVAEIQTDNSGAITDAKYLANAANSIPELTAFGNEDLVIYPNPSSGEFNVAKLNRKAALLKIFDVEGREAGAIIINNSFMTFSMASYPNGIYLFHVLDKTGVVISTGKLAVQK